MKTLINGQVSEYEISKSLKHAASKLGNNYKDFFMEEEGTIMLPLDQLILSRTRENGVLSAINRMHEAKNKDRTKRQAISVKNYGNNMYIVLDGNSTSIICCAANCLSVPVKVIS